MAATQFKFFDISTLDRGDFPRIIEIALFLNILRLSLVSVSRLDSLHGKMVNAYIYSLKENDLLEFKRNVNLKIKCMFNVA